MYKKYRLHNHLMLLIVLGGFNTVLQAQGRPFTVADSIGMRRFVTPDPGTSGRVTSFSPDGRFFAVVTTHGLLRDNLLESTIWLFDANAVRQFTLHPQAAPPTPRALTSLKGMNHTEPGDLPSTVRSMRWSEDSHSLFFLGRDGSTEWHLYRALLDEKEIDRLTPAGQNVAAFEFTQNRVVYAVALTCPLEPLPRVLVGTGLPMHSMTDTKPRRTCPNDNELWLVANGHVRPLIDPATRLPLEINTHYGDTLLSLSPDGRYVVAAHAIGVVPKQWTRYQSGARYDASGNTARIASVSPQQMKIASDVDVPEEMILVDLESGTNSSLLDAPLGRTVGFWGPTEASWSPDGKSIILTDVMLPVSGGTESDEVGRLNAAYVVQVNPESHAWSPVARLKQYSPADAHMWMPAVVQVDWQRTGVYVQYGPHGPAPETYRLIHGRWTQMPGSGPATDASDATPLDVMIRQNLNSPPALFVKLPASSGYGQLWDPNPQFKEIAFGHAEAITWKDAYGREIRGILIEPPDFRPGRRYPLVIEARSYRQDQFIVDGTYATAVAAQAMAADELMVLQAGEPEVPTDESFRKGTAAALAGYQAAIAKLSGEGLIDPHRAGIIGFSRTCDNVMHAVTQDPDLFAAATIANGFTYGPMGYLETVDDSIDDAAMKQWWLHYGGNPLGDALGTFERESMLFNLHRVVTPVRVETRDPADILTDWETYAGLRSLNGPVDLIVLPYATHIVTMPTDVYESQQGDVDWFRFWLQGYQDPDPAKKEQYLRWEHLRELRDADLKTRQPAPEMKPN
jgi:dipeptidyl aminopeptidase/acylaminoacyl peptidase